MRMPNKPACFSFRPLASGAIASAVALAFVVACGGGGSEAKSPSDTSAASGAPGSASNAGGAGAGPAAPTSGGATPTTTTALGDGGDLQGAKLESSTHKEVETKGDAGAKPAPGPSQEPGRRSEDIQTIIQTHRDDARACYDKGLKDHPGIEGKLDIKWTIDPQGAVTDASVDTSKSQILDPSVGNCVVEVIKKIKFAPSSKGFETHAHYPFDFHPRNNPGTKPGTAK
ncbi:hypothetical protein AKJ09_03498 [Labilithrix luteola]|uniref:TonB C-terminal domain-containing protein n=1 Tax=Labilithrix luteola TaxID=1391654 RepID=A0A0K1PUM1_9BACT|nr:AgmX/PglI C-terminal domain-containing protein [Labilithrix luteola]AKU96834.1 hypothetical protein AKJ09_03498 [Labilithrix luteola]